MKLTRAYVIAIIASTLLVALFALTGCGSSKGKVKADATSRTAQTAKAEAKKVLQSCFSKYSSKLPADYKQFGDCAGVPKQNRKAFAKDSVNAAFGAHLGTQNGRDNFYTVTLPQLQQKCQAAC